MILKYKDFFINLSKNKDILFNNLYSSLNGTLGRAITNYNSFKQLTFLYH